MHIEHLLYYQTTSANITIMQISNIVVIAFLHSHTLGLDNEVSIPPLVELNLLLFCFFLALFNTYLTRILGMKEENCAFPRKQPIAILQS